MHRLLMHCVRFLRAALIIDPYCTSYECMIVLLIGNVDWRLLVFPQSVNFHANVSRTRDLLFDFVVNQRACSQDLILRELEFFMS